MTDIQPDAGTPAPTPAPEGEYIPKAVYDREVQNHIKERNLWKPVARTFQSLADEQREAILGLADAVARGDMDSVVEWSIGTVENITGKSAAEAIAARQAQAGVGQAVGKGNSDAPPAPSLDEIRELARQEALQQYQRQAVIAEINGDLRSGGYEPDTPEAYAVIRFARDNNLRIPDAIKAFEERLASRFAGQSAAQVAAAQVAAGTPAPAPAGQPVGAVPSTLSPRERAIARLTGQAG